LNPVGGGAPCALVASVVVPAAVTVLKVMATGLVPLAGSSGVTAMPEPAGVAPGVSSVKVQSVLRTLL
jgi:saccharopine dehydrogenase-like NADP-dependent oxidoreductase